MWFYNIWKVSLKRKAHSRKWLATFLYQKKATSEPYKILLDQGKANQSHFFLPRAVDLAIAWKAAGVNITNDDTTMTHDECDVWRKREK